MQCGVGDLSPAQALACLIRASATRFEKQHARAGIRQGQPDGNSGRASADNADVSTQFDGAIDLGGRADLVCVDDHAGRADVEIRPR
jgi:hypothetical protein